MEPFSNSMKVEIFEYTCNVCETSGDFTGKNDVKIAHAIDSLKKKVVKTILEDFEHIGMSMAAIERALDLPQRTLTKWKNGISNPSTTGFALLKIIRTYPWILDVAQNKYEKQTAKKIFISHAVNEILESLSTYYQYAAMESGIITGAEKINSYFELETFEEETNVTSLKDVSVSGENIVSFFMKEVS